ncbi:DUF2281 domain-containing protein [Thiocystis violascens]|uniref:DUF2281 domain-containing protein n=1 Tax=Thiocystis violascens (strain ATCC 17096 / DSM 198 / 6111) TaxID=765911 RepID=I3Y799_THIV6|nr:DUF2281 domain-containing protein [Thiocystis violascens]AFL72867.1 Protein of unknown function (DUF2281) [Thiocystis violascens DSM 198]
MTIAERIYEIVKKMPEDQAAEVLDFVEFLQAKRATPPPRMPAEQARILRAEWQALVASQPLQTESAEDMANRGV